MLRIEAVSVASLKEKVPRRYPLEHALREEGEDVMEGWKGTQISHPKKYTAPIC